MLFIKKLLRVHAKICTILSAVKHSFKHILSNLMDKEYPNHCWFVLLLTRSTQKPTGSAKSSTSSLVKSECSEKSWSHSCGSSCSPAQCPNDHTFGEHLESTYVQLFMWRKDRANGWKTKNVPLAAILTPPLMATNHLPLSPENLTF